MFDQNPAITQSAEGDGHRGSGRVEIAFYSALVARGINQNRAAQAARLLALEGHPEFVPTAEDSRLVDELWEEMGAGAL